jgi:hypothetical protein
VRVFIPILAGALAFLTVAVAVTALLEKVVWPSVFVGVPAGVIAGVAVAVGTAWYLDR